MDRIVAAKATHPTIDISDLEAEIDHRVSRLYNLTDKEIAIVEGCAAGAKRTAVVAKPAKASVTRQPRKRVMTEDPNLA